MAVYLNISALRSLKRKKSEWIVSLAYWFFGQVTNLVRQPHYTLIRFVFAGQFIALLMLMIPSREEKLQYLGVFAGLEAILALGSLSGLCLYLIMKKRARKPHTRRFWIALGLGIVSLFFGYFFALAQSLGGIGLTEDGSGMASVISPLLEGDWKTFVHEASTTYKGYLTFFATMLMMSYVTSWPINDIFRRQGRSKKGLYDKAICKAYELVRKHIFKNNILPIEKMDIRLMNEFASMKYRVVRKVVSFSNFN